MCKPRIALQQILAKHIIAVRVLHLGQVLICALLYATAVRCNSTCSWLVLTARPWWGLWVFGASSLLSWLFSTQSAIEKEDLNLSWRQRSVARLASLLLIVIQTLSLASLCRPLARMNFYKWPARYLLGGYLLNVNFLDLLSLSPEVRWRRPEMLREGILESSLTLLKGSCCCRFRAPGQFGAGPGSPEALAHGPCLARKSRSGIFTWMAMITPVVCNPSSPSRHAATRRRLRNKVSEDYQLVCDNLCLHEYKHV